MEKIFANSATHFKECEFCGKRITEPQHQVWANVPDAQIDWAVEDNQKMEEQAAEEWAKAVDEFTEAHKNCQVRQ